VSRRDRENGGRVDGGCPKAPRPGLAGFCGFWMRVRRVGSGHPSTGGRATGLVLGQTGFGRGSQVRMRRGRSGSRRSTGRLRAAVRVSRTRILARRRSATASPPPARSTTPRLWGKGVSRFACLVSVRQIVGVQVRLRGCPDSTTGVQIPQPWEVRLPLRGCPDSERRGWVSAGCAAPRQRIPTSWVSRILASGFLLRACPESSLRGCPDSASSVVAGPGFALVTLADSIVMR
jgi:hypothetical protein